MPTMYSDSIRAFLKPIVPFLDDPEVLEIVVNGPSEIWVEKRGRITKTQAQFSEEGLLAACRNIAQFVGRTLNDERPRLDARLPDGSRIHVVLPPVARKGAILAVRKFSRETMTARRLVELGTVSPALAKFLDAAMQLRLNIIVAGGTGSGKTSLLNILSAFINHEERVVTIEDSAELQLQQANVISLESRPPDKFGKGEVTLADLLNSALRLRPDRIVVGEVRGGECFFLLQAMNTGHSGSMATTHANTPIDTLRRLESLCLMSGVELPLMAVRGQVGSAVNLIVCLERFADGSRKVTRVSEVLALDDRGEYRVQDIFTYVQTGRAPGTDAVLGHHTPTGIVPLFYPRFSTIGLDLPESFFDPAAHNLPYPPIVNAGNGDHTIWAPAIRARLTGQPVPPVPLWTDTTPLAATTPDVKPVPVPAKPAAARPPSPNDLTDPPPPRPAPPAPRPAIALPKSVPPPAPRPAPKPIMDEPTIQISDDLLQEAEVMYSQDKTHVGPIEDRTDPNIRSK